MSLKAFHMVFILASIALALGLGASELGTFHAAGGARHLFCGLGSIAAGALLGFYLWRFFARIKKIIPPSP